MSCSVGDAPRPPYSFGQCSPAYPASNNRRCQSVSHLRRSSHASRPGIAGSPGSSRASHSRSSARKAASASEGLRSISSTSLGSDGSSDSGRGGTMKQDLPKIISVDDHVVEPAHLWQTWLPERFRAAGPHVERRGIGTMRHIGGGKYEQTFDDDGPKADCWVYEDLVYINKRHVAAVGFDRDDMTMSPITYDEMRPGCYDPKARVEDMEINHVEASLSFPTFPRFCGQTFLEAKDRELAEACVYAYNDWMVEEWCGDSGGRLVPLIIVPLWDAELAAAEVRRNAARGVRAVCFSEIPPHLGLPSIHSGE